MLRSLSLGFVVGLLLGTLPSCSESRPDCGPCADGCCNINGQCVQGSTFDACGRGGGACEECNEGQVCAVDHCVSAPVDGGSPSDAGTPIDPSVGLVHVQFSLTSSVRGSFDPSRLLANVRGSFFRTQDVDPVFGPKKGVSKVLGIKVLSVDLRNRATSAQSFSGTLPPGDYTFLGVFDFNGNSTDDPGEPVTLFKTNEFTLGSGAELSKVISFDYIR